MKKRAALVASILALAAQTAAADPVPVDNETRDPSVALGLSVGTTAVSGLLLTLGFADHQASVGVLGAAGLLVLPSAGEWYSGKVLTAGLGLRALGALVGFAGLLQYVSGTHGFCEGDCGPDNAGTVDTGYALLAVGGVLALGGIVYDIVDAPRRAHRFNDAHHLQLAPSVAPTPTGIVPTVTLGGTF